MGPFHEVENVVWAPVFAAFAIQMALILPSFQVSGSIERHMDESQHTDAAALVTSTVPSSEKANMSDVAKMPVADQSSSQAQAKGDRAKNAADSKSAKSAKSAAQLSDVVVNGKKLSSAQESKIAASKGDYASHVEYIDQYEIMPAGCEIVACAVALRSFGYSIDPTEIADEYLETDGSDKDDYYGSPYDDGMGFPPSIVHAANGWLADHSGRGALAVKAYDVTKSEFDDLAELVKCGYPVLMWVTEGMVEPWDTDETWYAPEHCVVLYGVGKDEVLVSDSLEGLVKRNKKKFAHIYDLCGKQAVAFLPI